MLRAAEHIHGARLYCFIPLPGEKLQVSCQRLGITRHIHYARRRYPDAGFDEFRRRAFVLGIAAQAQALFIEDMLENLYDGEIILYIIASDENILILGGASVNFPVNLLIELTDELGLTDPYDLTPNTDIPNALVEMYVDRIAAYASFAYAEF